MNNINPQQTRSFEKIRLILNEMKEKCNLYGVALSNREGDLISENLGKDFDGKLFAAMNASVMKSAEELEKTIDGKEIRKIITELYDKTIIIINCGEKALLTIFLEKHSINGTIMNELEDYVKKISDIY